MCTPYLMNISLGNRVKVSHPSAVTLMVSEKLIPPLPSQGRSYEVFKVMANCAAACGFHRKPLDNPIKVRYIRLSYFTQ